MTLLRILSSDWLKTKRTAVRIIIMAAPVAYALVFLLYFGTFAQTSKMQYNIHEAFFQSGTIFLPMAAGLFAGLLCSQEEHAGNFNGMLIQASLNYFTRRLRRRNTRRSLRKPKRQSQR